MTASRFIIRWRIRRARVFCWSAARIAESNAIYRAIDLEDDTALELCWRTAATPTSRRECAADRLGLAARVGDLSPPGRFHAKALLDGRQPFASTREGLSPYRLTLQFGLTEVAALLKVRTDAPDISDDECFVAACARGDEADARAVGGATARPAGALSAAQLRLLPDMAAAGADDIVKLMVRLGWPIAVRGGDWDASAINLAVFRGDAGLTRFLLEHGAKWTEQHGHGDNACGTLVWASRNEPVEGGDWAAARALCSITACRARPPFLTIPNGC